MMKNLLSQPTVTFCEKITNNFVSRPNYALSNLAYFIVALILFYKVKQSKIFLPFAILALTIGSFSMFYDIRPLYLTQLLDLLAMLILANLIIFLNLIKLYKFDLFKSILAATALIVTGMVIVLTFQSYAGNYVFGFFILCIIITEFLIYRKKLHKDYGYWLAALLIFVIASILWIPDGTKTHCNQILLLNGRAVFHYLTAISICLLAFFYSKNDLSVN